jgi:hypothetical protein
MKEDAIGTPRMGSVLKSLNLHRCPRRAGVVETGLRERRADHAAHFPSFRLCLCSPGRLSADPQTAFREGVGDNFTCTEVSRKNRSSLPPAEEGVAEETADLGGKDDLKRREKCLELF